MSIQGIGPGTGIKRLSRILATEEGRNAVAQSLGGDYARGKTAGANFLGRILKSLPEGEEANFIGGVQKAKNAEEARLYA